MSSNSIAIINRSKSSGLTKSLNKSKNSESTISILSVEMNTKLKKILKHPILSGMAPLKHLSISHSSHQSLQFSKIINKIEAVTDKVQIIQNDIEIQEGKVYEYNLNKREKLLISLNAKGKTCPLVVKLQKTGQIIVFVSSTHSNPDENNSDKIFKSEKFSISDKNSKFQLETLYFGILAEESSDLKIFFEFSQDKRIFTVAERFSSLRAKTAREIQMFRNNSELKENFYNHVENLLKKRRKKTLELSNNKDFLKINKKVISIDNKRDLLRSRSQARIQKTHEAIEKKKIILQEKTEKVKSQIFKKELTRQEALKREIDFSIKKEKNIILQNWYILTYFFKFADVVYEKFKNLKILKEKTKKSASKIQKIYKR